MWFSLQPAGPELVASAPRRFDHLAVLGAPPARVFEVLADLSTYPGWFHDLVSAEWTSPPPHGEGSTRLVALRSLTVRERILVHEEPRRIVYVMEQSTLPIVRRYVGEMTLEPFGERETRFRWVAAYEPTALMRVVHPLARLPFDRMFRRSVANLARYLGSER